MTNEIKQAMHSSTFGHPNVYPNSENIQPPREKPKLRVVEPSTRASVNMDLLQQWHEILDRRNYAEKAYLREEYALKIAGRTSTIDITV
jgi:hypothetical protein